MTSASPALRTRGLAALLAAFIAGSLDAATLTSDKERYVPGEQAILTGSGFEPGEPVELVVVHADGTVNTGSGHDPWVVVADGLGGFVTSWTVCGDDCLFSQLEAQALGLASGSYATVQFYDPPPSDFENLDFAASNPETYDLCSGGGVFNNKVESLNDFPLFRCGDIVSFFLKVDLKDVTEVPSQDVEFEIGYRRVTTGGSRVGLGFTRVVRAVIDPNDKHNVSDGDEVVTILEQPIVIEGGRPETRLKARLTNLEPGESVVVRMDVKLECAPGSPSGNVQARARAFRRVSPDQKNIGIGTQTINLNRQRVIDRPHLGWNWVDNQIKLTKNEPCYWSAATGQPKGLSPFGVLDPDPFGWLPGRDAPDGSGERVLRGFVIAYAINADGHEIRWNHLKGDATIVNYDTNSAWEYNAYGFAVVDPTVAHGAASGTPGVLNLDGAEYATGFDLLLMDFYGTGLSGFSLKGEDIFTDTDLTLLPIDLDLRQESLGPVSTKAHFDVWNEYEVKFSGAYRCITCWDQWLLGDHGIPNHFLRAALQTDKGKARIDGLASQLCDIDNDPKDQKEVGEDLNDVVSEDASMLGVVMKRLLFGDPDPGAADAVATAGTNLHGMGSQPGVIRVDLLGPPDEAVAPEDRMEIDPVRELLQAALSADRRGSTRGASDAEGGAAGVGAPPRVSASDKASLVIFPKVELRWDEDGNLIQDTFLDLSNDYPEGVQVQMYFIQGDPPVDCQREKF